jgi:site-specific recombinase XerD
VLEFFTAQINNDHTRKAYKNAARRSAESCDAHKIGQPAEVQPFHVAAFIKQLQRAQKISASNLRANSLTKTI